MLTYQWSEWCAHQDRVSIKILARVVRPNDLLEYRSQFFTFDDDFTASSLDIIILVDDAAKGNCVMNTLLVLFYSIELDVFWAASRFVPFSNDMTIP